METFAFYRWIENQKSTIKVNPEGIICSGFRSGIGQSNGSHLESFYILFRPAFSSNWFRGSMSDSALTRGLFVPGSLFLPRRAVTLLFL